MRKLRDKADGKCDVSYLIHFSAEHSFVLIGSRINSSLIVLCTCATMRVREGDRKRTRHDKMFSGLNGHNWAGTSVQVFYLWVGCCISKLAVGYSFTNFRDKIDIWFHWYNIINTTKSQQAGPLFRCNKLVFRITLAVQSLRRHAICDTRYDACIGVSTSETTFDLSSSKPTG